MMAPPFIFLCPGHGEEAKAWAHGLLGVAALGCFAYNAGAWLLRHERHLGWNSVVYSGIGGFEIKQVLRHIATASQPTARLPAVMKFRLEPTSRHDVASLLLRASRASRERVGA